VLLGAHQALFVHGAGGKNFDPDRHFDRVNSQAGEADYATNPAPRAETITILLDGAGRSAAI